MNEDLSQTPDQGTEQQEEQPGEKVAKLLPAATQRLKSFP